MGENPAWVDVQEQVAAMIRNLGKLMEQTPDALIDGDEFNPFLERARVAFPGSAAIRDVKKIDNVTTLANLMVKLSIIQGAVQAAFKNRMFEAAEAARRRPRPNAGILGDMR